MRTSVVFFVFFTVTRTVFGECPSPTKGENMELSTSVPFPAAEGTSVTFVCDLGSTKIPRSASGTITCSGGQWSQLDMRCELKNCGSTDEVLNGYVDFSEGTKFGAFARVVCNEGYMAVGADKQIYCGLNGWEGRLQVCEVSKCDKPENIANGYFSPEKDDYDHNEVISYFCNGDFERNGPEKATCEDGQFKPAPPTCVSVNCKSPIVTNGGVAGGTFQPPYKLGSSVTFKCNRGHNLKGRETVSCDINSEWSPPLPECDPVKCKTLEIKDGELVDGPRPSYKFGDTVKFKCKEGFDLKGANELTCGEKNQWSAAPPVCTQKSSSNTLAIVLSILGAIIALLCGGLCYYCGCLKKKKGPKKYTNASSQDPDALEIR